jgi:hypothetical protein
LPFTGADAAADALDREVVAVVMFDSGQAV